MPIKNDAVSVIGAGLAGCEAAWQLAKRGIRVTLYEKRPHTSDAAHKTAAFAELVCSNSLRAANIENAVGLLKEEMRKLDSLIIRHADNNRVPAGGALAVDRIGFAESITQAIKTHPNISVVNDEVTDLQNIAGKVIVATGPLTDGALAESIGTLVQEDYFHFFDAAAPIVAADSLDYSKIFRASRYDKGDADYLNCPFKSKEEYVAFREALRTAEMAEIKEFEKETYFEACMPIEEMARRGEDTMRYGPLKPVGLVDVRNGEKLYAVVQLRQDNAVASLYNIVGFQTHLKWGEQKRVFGMIPGLENAEFVRYGVMHKNSYINSPKLLDNRFNLLKNENYYFAGQLTGVEGYVESAAAGLMAGIHLAREFDGKSKLSFPIETAHGALAAYISNPAIDNFQPMNINFGLIPSLGKKIRGKRLKNAAIAERALASLDSFIQENEL